MIRLFFPSHELPEALPHGGPASFADIKAELAVEWAKGLSALATAVGDIPWAWIGDTIARVTLMLLTVFIAVTIKSNKRKRKSVANLPGPPAAWSVFGHLPQVAKDGYTLLPAQWLTRGLTGRYDGLVGEPVVYTADGGACTHILNDIDTFQPLKSANGALSVLGNNTVTGEQERKLEKVFATAFSPEAMRRAMSSVWDSCYDMKAYFDKLVSDKRRSFPSTPSALADAPEDRSEGARKLDLLYPMDILALNIMGRTIFGTDLGLYGDQHQIVSLHIANGRTSHARSGLAGLQNLSPILDKIPTANRRSEKQLEKAIVALAREMILCKIREIVVQREQEKEGAAATQSTHDDHHFLTTLVKQRHWPSEPDMRLTENEVFGTIVSSLTSGASAIAGSLAQQVYLLALRPHIQQQLRSELQGVTEDRPDLDTLNKLPYLDKVVRECLRLHPSMPVIVREAVKDTTLPLGTSVRGRNGELIREVALSKGTKVLISIVHIERNTDIWGPDADQFNPDRFDDPAAPLVRMPTMRGDTLSPHCPTSRLVEAQLKAALFVLLRPFSFQRLPSAPEIKYKPGVIPHPYVVGEPQVPQLPVLVRQLNLTQQEATLRRRVM